MKNDECANLDWSEPSENFAALMKHSQLNRETQFLEIDWISQKAGKNRKIELVTRDKNVNHVIAFVRYVLGITHSLRDVYCFPMMLQNPNARHSPVRFANDYKFRAE